MAFFQMINSISIQIIFKIITFSEKLVIKSAILHTTKMIKANILS